MSAARFSGSPQLRLTAAVNLFKQDLLGDLHVPGKHQASAVFKAIDDFGLRKHGSSPKSSFLRTPETRRIKALDTGVRRCDGSISASLNEKTWKSWFSEPPVVPKIDKIKVLDTLAASMRQVPRKRRIASKPPSEAGPLSDLVHGGLVRQLLAPSKTKRELPTLIARSVTYKPRSPLHLHFDAIDVDSRLDDFGDTSGAVVKRIAAQRILDLLADRWGPRAGSIYSELSSNLKLEWESASEEDRLVIRRRWSGFKPDLFDFFMKEAPQPNWKSIGVEADVSPLHIHKVLFALSAAPGFLVGDRLTAWSLDLATSAFALHALASVDREILLGSTITDEMIFCRAFDQLLFNPEWPELDDRDLQEAMASCRAPWSTAVYKTLLNGRNCYRSSLKDLGIRFADE
jgi:hypothetical protein